MGIHIEVQANIDVGIFFRRGGRKSRVLDDFARALPELIEDPLLREFLDMDRPRDTQLVVSFHPLGWVEFSFEGKALVCSARTNPVGPGYHAYLVELLDRLATRLGFAWMWGDADAPADETGYALARDFAALERAMCDWLRALAKSVTQDDEIAPDGCMALCLDTHLGAAVSCVADGFAATPLGFRGREWFEQVAQSEGPDEACRSFFVWHERELGAEMWLRTGLALAWGELPWHAPASPEERKAYELTLSCFSRAKQLAPGIEVPDDTKVIRQLLKAAPEDGCAPPPGGVGYRRGPILHELPHGWRLVAPGYYYHDIGEDGATLILFHGRRSIQIRLAARTTGRAYDTLLEKLAGSARAELTDLREADLKSDHVQGKAWIGKGEEGSVLIGFAGAGHSVCLTTIVDGDAETSDWPEATWRSLQRSMPEA